MKKPLLPIIYFIVFLIFAGNISAQQSVIISDEVLELRAQKTELLNTMLLTETILDSVIHYKYTSETDSVRILKKIFKVDDDGKFETRMEYSWHNNQWVDSAKTEITFNDLGLIILYDQFLWDIEQSTWVHFKNMTFTYDENGYDDLLTYLIWNTESNEWDKSYKEDSDYNEHGNLLSIVEWLGNDNNDWEYYYKEINTYNTNEYLIESYIAFWNVDIEEWENYQKEEFTYHESGLTKDRLYYLWMAGEWQLSLKTDYYYTVSDVFDSLVTYQWNLDEWLLFAQTKYEYDENDNLLSRLELRWENEAWADKVKTEMEYDENNNRILYVRSSWSESEDGWVYENKFEDLYDEMNNHKMRSSYYWSLELDQWIGLSMSESVYNDERKTLLRAEYIWDELLADWAVDEKAFYYRSIVTQMPEMEANNFLVYPNPVKNTLFIKSQSSKNISCTIVSMSGRQIIQFDINGSDVRISMENLPKGIYFLQINSESETITKKVIKY